MINNAAIEAYHEGIYVADFHMKHNIPVNAGHAGAYPEIVIWTAKH
jgi:hypothetical protein